MQKLNGRRLPLGVASSRSLYFKYKGRCNREGIEFSLSFDELILITGRNCSYCGVEPKQLHKSHKGYNGGYTYNGIDRIDPNVGYIVSNCIPCCKSCNYMKRNMKQEEFIDHIKAIIIHFKGGLA